MSQKTRFQLGGIYDFEKQKAEIEGLKKTMPGVADVKLGENKVVKFVHDPSTTTAEIKKALKKMDLRPTVSRIMEK